MTAVLDRAEFDHHNPGRPVFFGQQQAPAVTLVYCVKVGDDRLDETGRTGIARSLYIGAAARLDMTLAKGFIAFGEADRAGLAPNGRADFGRDLAEDIGPIGPRNKPLPVTLCIGYFCSAFGCTGSGGASGGWIAARLCSVGLSP